MSASTCGNHILEGTEQCDDSNTANGDGCDSTCHMESGTMGAMCGGPTQIVITSAGRYIYTGDTTGGTSHFTSGSAMCPSAGPDVAFRIQFNTGRSFHYTLSVTPAPPSMWDVVLEGGAACPPNFCTQTTASGTEQYAYLWPNTTVLQQLVDGATASDHGPFVMQIDVMIP